MSWVRQVRQRHAAFQQALAASLPDISVPIGDSDYTAPGYLYYGHFFSCVPDAAYPWDPAVLAAIREFCPDAMPILIRSVWRNGDYGQMDEPFVVVRHGIARAIRDPKLPIHENLNCRMPSLPTRGLCIPGRSILDCRPNYLEAEWYDPDNRPWGHDLPGAYLPFDWEFYHSLRRCHDDNSGVTVRAIMDQKRSERARRDRSRREEERYIRRDFEKFYSVEPSDVEWKEAMLGGAKVSEPVSITVP